MYDFVHRDLPKFLVNENTDARGGYDLHILKDRFKGRVVIDLGAGDHWFGYFLATVLGAKSYVGVEKFQGKFLKTALQGKKPEDIEHFLKGITSNPNKASYGYKSAEQTQIPEAAVAEDNMLSFLERLPDNSVSVFMFGINTSIIPDEKHRELVKTELLRVLANEGGYLEDNGLASSNLSDVFGELDKPSSGVDYLMSHVFAGHDSPKLFIQTEDLKNSKKRYISEIKSIYEQKEKMRRERFEKENKTKEISKKRK